MPVDRIAPRRYQYCEACVTIIVYCEPSGCHKECEVCSFVPDPAHHDYLHDKSVRELAHNLADFYLVQAISEIRAHGCTITSIKSTGEAKKWF